MSRSLKKGPFVAFQILRKIKDGKGKELLYRHEERKTKWRKVEYKKGKLISFKN